MSFPSGPIRGIRYHNPRWPNLPLEAVSVPDFWRRAPAAHFQRPRRPDFHHLMLCTAGRGTHTIDFERVPIRAGRVVHVRPGQVHAFGWTAGMEGVVVMFGAEALPREEAALAGALPPVMALDRRLVPEIATAFHHLLEEYGRHNGEPTSQRLLQHLLAATVLRLAMRHGQRLGAARSSHHEVHRLFEAAVEQAFLNNRRVAEYARRLGYTTRTLARATAETEGLSPKAMIDARVVLEAKRLLALTSWTVGRIAVHLGFSEPTNFTKFFRHRTGLSPEGFRATHAPH